MERRSWIIVALPLTLALCAAAFGYASIAEKAPQPRKPMAGRRSVAEACGSPSTYERLKARLFDEAAEVRGARKGDLDLLAGSAVVRVKDPLIKARDDNLGVTVCTGEFIIELPPGAERGFGGRRRLTADVEYAAQTAADGSGIVYQLRGAEPIVYRLAAFGLSGEAVPTVEVQPAVAIAQPIPELAEEESAPILIKLPAEQPATEPSAAKKSAAPPEARKKAAERPLAIAEKAKVEVRTPKAKAEKVIRKAEIRKTVARSVNKKPVKIVPAKSGHKAKIEPRKAVIVAKAKPAKKIDPPKLTTAKAKPVPKPKAVPKIRKAVVPVCRAGSRAAQLVCANPALAAKERRTTSLYYSALENSDRRSERLLRQTAGNFQTYLSGCASEACISQAYDGRMREIRDILADMR